MTDMHAIVEVMQMRPHLFESRRTFYPAGGVLGKRGLVKPLAELAKGRKTGILFSRGISGKSEHANDRKHQQTRYLHSGSTSDR